MDNLTIIIAAASITAAAIGSIFSAGLIIGFFKKTLNGSVEATHRIEDKLDAHLTDEAVVNTRLGRIEGQLEVITKRGNHGST